MICFMITKCATHLRRDFFNIIKEVQTSGEPILIANRQGHNVVLMDEADYKSIINTIEILSNPVECDKVMHPDFSNSKKYVSLEDFEKDLDLEEK